MESIVYFLQRENGDIKIGTTIHPLQRLRAQVQYLHKPMVLLGTIPGGIREENELHERFWAFKIKPALNHDWFSPCPELLTFIRQNAMIDDELAHRLYRYWHKYFQGMDACKANVAAGKWNESRQLVRQKPIRMKVNRSP